MMMRRNSMNRVFLLFLLAAAGCAERPAPPAEPPAEPPVGRLGTSVTPLRYQIELDIDPSRERFSGDVSIDIAIKQPTNSIWLHGKNLNVSAVQLLQNGKAVAAAYEEKLDSGVALVSVQGSPVAGEATLTFAYDAPFNTSANALFKVTREGKSYAATQFQPTGARQVFPGFDEPGFKVPFDLTLITRAEDVVVTTTPEASSTALGDGRVEHRFETTRPLPTYLIAIAVGPYDLVDYGTLPATGLRTHELPLRGLAAAGSGDKLEYALANTDGLLAVLENYFGTPYPYRKLDLIAVPESFGGAMENVGAIMYDEYLLLLDDDASIDQRRAYTSVHAHELAHMWFGNLVTPRWWNDIWLNESFASWMDNKTSNIYWPEGEFDRETLKGALSAMDGDSLAAARQIREPVERNEDIGTAFDSITYSKGGGVLAMLERYVGEERFRDGVRLHMSRFADGVATAEDFIESVAEGSERPEIGAAFKSFIEQPGVPLLAVSLACESGQPPRLDVKQSRYTPLGSSIDGSTSAWQVPMCVSMMSGGERVSSCTLVSGKQQSVPLGVDDCPTVVHPNADGAGYYRFALDEPSWRKLIENSGELPAAEALTMVDSLEAAFRSGDVSAEIFVAGMAALINHEAWDVASTVTAALTGIERNVPPGKRESLHGAFRELAGPRFARLAGKTDARSTLLRQRLQQFLILTARDPDLRAPLAAKAAARIGLNGDPDPKAVPPEELQTVLTVGVQELGEPFFDLLMEQAVASANPAFRNAAIGALARVQDHVLADKLHKAVSNGDFKGTEFVGILFGQMSDPATVDLTFEWLQQNDDLISRVPETFRGAFAPALGTYFCSSDRANEWRDFIEARADLLPGYERRLLQTLESIELCAALREASGDELVDALTL
jgi:alanyl aminopeptidase